MQTVTSLAIIFYPNILSQLVRHFLSASLQLVGSNGWKVKHIKQLGEVLASEILGSDNPCPDGLRFHLTDVYLEELEKLLKKPVKLLFIALLI